MTRSPTPVATTQSALASGAWGSARAPLTNLVVKPAVERRRAIAVPVVVRSTGTTARGLGSADVVFVSWEAGKQMRCLALFQSQDATVGPVGRLSPTDLKILPVVRAAVGSLGGPPDLVARASGLGLQNVARTKTAAAYHLLPGKGGQWVASIKQLRLASRAVESSAPFVLRATASRADETTNTPITRVSVGLPAFPATQWSWESKTRSFQARVATDTVRANNIVLLRMRYTRGTVGGTPTLVPDAIGSGVAQVVSGQHGSSGTWVRRSNRDIFLLLDRNKNSIKLDPGRTWVYLLPAGSTMSIK